MLRDGPWVVTALDETRARIFKDVSGHEEYREGVSLAALADGFDYTTLPQRVALLDTRGIAGGFTKFGTGLVGSAKHARPRAHPRKNLYAMTGRDPESTHERIYTR